MIKEHACFTEECPEAGRVVEHYYRSTDPDPVCESCSQPMKQLISRFGVVFTGSITQQKYLDKTLPGGYEADTGGGQWQFRVKSAEDPNKPEPVYLQTFKERREWAKAEGLNLYEDSGPVDTDSNGKRSTTRTGSPGTWV